MIPRPLPALALLLFTFAPAARGDLGAENVLLVVNADSVASRTVANHYAAARGVAGVAVVTLRDLPDWERTDVAAFRTAVLGPALAAADARGLSAQLDAVVYCPAIPTAIDLWADLAGLDPKPPHVFTPVGSLTGLTTLYEAVLSEQPREYLAPNANAAFADAAGLEDPPTAGFRRAIGFAADRTPTTGPGRRYLVCGLLGVTGGRGEGVDEVVARVRAVAAADGTAPAGSVAFCDTPDVRSTTRQPRFDAAVAAIGSEAERRGLDVTAAVVVTALPRRRPRLVGVTAGLAGADGTAWLGTGSGFAPGAFADNLTSFGGVLTERGRGGQVTVVDWLRFGASAAGGTVTEPYALAFKFPTPFVHLHRLRGVTLGEAVVRSVSGPYQYLTVGDPLSNPYARRPRVTLAPFPNEPATGVLKPVVAATDETGEPAALAAWELFADGRRIGVAPAGVPFASDTTDLADGATELLAVAVADDPARGRGRARRAVALANGGRRVALTLAGGADRVTWGEPLRVRVAAAGFGTGPAPVVIRHGFDEVAAGTLTGEEGGGGRLTGVVTVDSRPLGLGPVTLRAEVTPEPGVKEENEPAWGPGGAVRSGGVRIEVTAPRSRAASVAAGAVLPEGPVLRWAGGEEVLADGLPPGWLAAAGAPAGGRFRLTAIVTATEPGLHRLAVRTNCGVRVAVGGEAAPPLTGPSAASGRGAAWRSVPVWLDAGRHRLTLTGRVPAEGAPILRVKWGRRGSGELSS